MIKLKVNEIEIEVEEGLTVLQACEIAGFEIFSHGISIKNRLINP